MSRTSLDVQFFLLKTDLICKMWILLIRLGHTLSPWHEFHFPLGFRGFSRGMHTSLWLAVTRSPRPCSANSTRAFWTLSARKSEVCRCPRGARCGPARATASPSPCRSPPPSCLATAPAAGPPSRCPCCIESGSWKIFQRWQKIF